MTPRSVVPLAGIEVVIGLYLEARKRQSEPVEARPEPWSAHLKEMAQRWGWDESGK